MKSISCVDSLMIATIFSICGAIFLGTLVQNKTKDQNIPVLHREVDSLEKCVTTLEKCLTHIEDLEKRVKYLESKLEDKQPEKAK